MRIGREAQLFRLQLTGGGGGGGGLMRRVPDQGGRDNSIFESDLQPIVKPHKCTDLIF